VLIESALFSTHDLIDFNANQLINVTIMPVGFSSFGFFSLIAEYLKFIPGWKNYPGIVEYDAFSPQMLDYLQEMNHFLKNL